MGSWQNSRKTSSTKLFWVIILFMCIGVFIGVKKLNLVDGLKSYSLVITSSAYSSSVIKENVTVVAEGPTGQESTVVKGGGMVAEGPSENFVFNSSYPPLAMEDEMDVELPAIAKEDDLNVTLSGPDVFVSVNQTIVLPLDTQINKKYTSLDKLEARLGRVRAAIKEAETGNRSHDPDYVPEDRSKIHWVKWERMMASKSVGGWGLGSLRAFNLSLMCKWWWRAKDNPNDLWFKVVSALHNQRRTKSFLPIKLTLGGVWKSICGVEKELSLYGLNLCDMFACQVGYEGEKWTWKEDESGVFTSASMRRKIKESYGWTFEERLDRNNWVPIKVNFHIWRVLIDRLPTRSNLVLRGMLLLSERCPVCWKVDENSEHLTFRCDFAREIWQVIMQWCRLPLGHSNSLYSLLAHVQAATSNAKKRKWLDGVIRITILCIWLARNEFIFKGRPLDVAAVVEEVKSKSYLWINNRAKSHKLDWGSWGVA